jgi:hypothetical protein
MSAATLAPLLAGGQAYQSENPASRIARASENEVTASFVCSSRLPSPDRSAIYDSTIGAVTSS